MTNHYRPYIIGTALSDKEVCHWTGSISFSFERFFVSNLKGGRPVTNHYRSYIIGTVLSDKEISHWTGSISFPFERFFVSMHLLIYSVSDANLRGNEYALETRKKLLNNSTKTAISSLFLASLKKGKIRRLVTML